MLGGVNVIMLNNNVKLIVSWLLVIIWGNINIHNVFNEFK